MHLVNRRCYDYSWRFSCWRPALWSPVHKHLRRLKLCHISIASSIRLEGVENDRFVVADAEVELIFRNAPRWKKVRGQIVKVALVYRSIPSCVAVGVAAYKLLENRVESSVLEGVQAELSKPVWLMRNSPLQLERSALLPMAYMLPSS